MNESTNPYASPKSLSSEAEGVMRHAVVPAGRGLRFLNFVIDYIAQTVIGIGVGFLVVFVGEEEGEAFLDRTPSLVFGILILLGYYLVFEATTSRTLGKLLTGTKVVSQDGGEPTLGQIVGRTFARLIPFEAFSFLGPVPRGWHDSLPKTTVIKVR